MRNLFADTLLEEAKKDNRIFVVTVDLGYKIWDQFRDELPEQFLNTGASEQAAAGIAIGLALEGKVPFLYSISTFLIYRCFETLRTYIDHENISVKLVGSGRDKDYELDGFSHDAMDVKPVLDLLSGRIRQYWPEDKEQIPGIVQQMINNDCPSFVSLKR